MIRFTTLFFVISSWPVVCHGEERTAVLEEVVVTASRSGEARGNRATTLQRISSNQLNLAEHVHINEIMQRVSGAWISRGNGQEHLTAIRSPVLTGAGGCGAFLMAQDGISLRATGFCNVNELFEANSEQAGNIEVLKGPGSAFYGSNAMHGVINVISAPLEPISRLSLEAGPDQYLRGKLSTGGSQLRLDLNLTRDEGYKADSGFAQQKGTLQLRHPLAGAEAVTRLSFANLNQETAGFVQGFMAYKDDLLKATNPNPEAFRDARSVRLHSELFYQLPDSSLVLKPYFRYTDMHFIQHFLPGQPLEENGHRSLGLQSAWYLGDDKWIIGTDLERTSGYLTEYQAGPITSSAFLARIIPPGFHYDYKVEALTAAVFAEGRWQSGNKLKIQAGLRLEYNGYDYDNRMLDGNTPDDGTPCPGTCRFSRPADRSDTFTELSPKLGMTYALTNRQQLYSRVALGFRAPQATELYRLQGGQSVTSINPESISSLELGWRGYTRHLDFDISLYLMAKDNVIFRDTSRQTVDNGQTSHQGIEMNLRYSVSDSLMLTTNFTLARHRYENNPALSNSALEGNEVDTAPGTLGSLQLLFLPAARTQVELEWVHLSRYFTDPENLHRYDGHNLLNLRARYSLPDWELAVRFMNLADTDYAERADFGFGQDRYFVGTPRSIFVSISKNFQ